jgi:hypothetical protein
MKIKDALTRENTSRKEELTTTGKGKLNSLRRIYYINTAFCFKSVSQFRKIGFS